MRLFRTLVVLVIIVGAIGFWRGWFTFGTNKDLNGNQELHMTVDKNKINQDLNVVKDKINHPNQPENPAPQPFPVPNR